MHMVLLQMINILASGIVASDIAEYCPLYQMMWTGIVASGVA